MNNILKQTIANMRQQPLISWLTIIGTALAICLIMVVMMTREVQIVDYGSEPNRSRTLYVKYSHNYGPNYGNAYNGALHANAVRGVFLNMKTPEAVAVYSAFRQTHNVAIAGGDIIPLSVMLSNQDYFKIFSLKFIEGQPFTKEECESNLPIAILSRSSCRKLFGQESGIKGKNFFIENHEFRVAGVVEDVSKVFTTAHSDIWIPIGSKAEDNSLADVLHTMYSLSVAMMAKDKGDMPKIRQEVKRNLAVFNKSTMAPDTLDIMEQPDDQEAYVNHKWSNPGPDMHSIHMRYLLIFIILLIVPAINIASMTQSRLRQRETEIGVRRAFGAKRSTILLQTMAESLIQTVAAGILGFIFCIVFCYILADYIFCTNDIYRQYGMNLDLSIFFSPEIYGWALLFCLILNVLSSTIPAWKASRSNIVETLK